MKHENKSLVHTLDLEYNLNRTTDNDKKQLPINKW